MFSLKPEAPEERLLPGETQPRAPRETANPALASFLLHLIVLGLLIWLPDALQLRRKPPSPPKESIVRIVPFEPIPDVLTPSVPGGARSQRPAADRPGGAGAKGAAKPSPPPPRGTAQDFRAPGPEPKPAPASGQPRATEAAPERNPPPSPPSPGRVASPSGRSEPEKASGEATTPERFDVSKALRDFRRPAVRRPPAGEPGTEPGGGRGLGTIGGLSVPDLPPLPDSGFRFGNLQFESRDYDWTDYGRQIYMAIWRAWHNRLYLTVDAFEKWGYQNQLVLIDHRSRVRFRISSSGEVTDVAIEQGSGCVPLDGSAVDALREVVLPPLPSDFPRAQETIHATFVAYGEIQSMRPTLRYLKNRGFF